MPDIYGLFGDEPHEANKENVESLGKALSEKIAERLAEVRSRPTGLRMSNIGKPARQLWYDIHGEHVGEKLEPYTKIKFMFGDILELLLLFLAKEAGHEVSHEQDKVEVDGVFGSKDAHIDGVVVDVKSASTYAFKKFREGKLADDDPFGYMDQLGGYVTGTEDGSKDGAFLAIDKQLGHVALLPVPNEDIKALNTRERIEYLKKAIDTPEPPERCYPDEEEGKSGNRVLGINCSYCAHKFHCWKDANDGVGLRTFIYAKGPKHFTKVEKEPNVIEVTF